MRRARNILLLIAWLSGMGLTNRGALAAALLQDSAKPNKTVFEKSDAGAQGAEKPIEIQRKIHLEQDSTTTSQHSLIRLAGDFLQDQRHIWTSPAKLRFSDTEWLVPLSGVTAGLFVTDRDFSKHLSQNPTTIRHYKTL